MLQDSETTQPADAAAPAAPAAPTPLEPMNTGMAGTGFAGNSEAEAFNKFGFENMIQHMDAVNWTVFVALILMSLGSWFYTVVNVLKNMMLRSRAEMVIRTFWETTNAQDAIRFMEEQPAGEPFSKIALDCAQAAAHHQRHEGSRLVEALNRSEFIDRALRQAVTRESSKLETGMTLLATVGATAPFVGLLGTVWGIYHALVKIGATGQASIDAVAGPVGEALIMTALGLFVAIPAVFAYNFFARMNRNTNANFDTFAHDLHDFFATGSRVGEMPAKR